MSDAPKVVLTYEVENMDCADCVRKVESALSRLPGVEEARASYASGKVKLVLERPLDEATLKAALEPLGYSLRAPGNEEDSWPFGFRWAAWTTAFYALAWVLYLAGLGNGVFAIPALVGVAPLAQGALRGFRQNPFGIHTLVSVATLGALLIGAGAEAGAVVILFLIGEGLETLAARRARRGLKGLGAMLPQVALRLTPEGGVEEVPAATLRPGDRVRVATGARIPADGRVLEGEAEVDEAFLTGESVPVFKRTGDVVYAGSRVVSGGLLVTVEAPADEGLLAEITRLAEDALSKKGATERFIDRFSRYYTPGVLAVALFTAGLPPLLWGAPFLPWVYKALALLLIGCPCALVLSVPAATASAIARGARSGLLFKSAAAVEALANVRTVAFDKTGTLTRGAPELVQVEALALSEREALALAAALEAASDHSLARAVRKAAEEMDLVPPPAEGHEVKPGVGVFAEVGGRRVGLVNPRHLGQGEGAAGTEAWLVAGERVLARFRFADAPRPEARATIEGLRRRGLRVKLLTGDAPKAAAALAEAVGLLPEEVEAGLLPQEKLQRIEALRGEGGVAMVGDGVNDAPALAAADVGVAVWSGTQAALDSADAALLREDLRGLLEMHDLARRTRATMTGNIAFALGLKGVFLLTTLLGLTGLWPAVLSDTGATVLVTLNSARLLGFRTRP